MVQVIGQEGLGDILGQQVGGGLSSGLQMLLEAKIKGIQQQKQMQQLQGFFGGISPEGQTIEEENQDTVSIQDKDLVEPQRLPLQQKLMLEQQYPGSAKLIESEEDRKVQKYESLKNLKDISKKTSTMLDLIDFTGPAKLITGLDPETRRRRQQFDTLAIALEKEAAARVGKGTLNKARFEFLKKTLPSSLKTQAGNIGALEAWNEELGLEMPEFAAKDEIEQKEEIKIKKVPQGTQVTEEIVDMLLKKSGNNVEKARKLARSLGYEF